MPKARLMALDGIAGGIPPGQLATLLKVSGALTASLDIREVLQTAIESAVELLDLDTGAIYLVEDDSLFLGATTPPLPPDFPEEYRRALTADHPHIGMCLDTADVLYIPDAKDADLTDAERGVSEARGLRSLLYVPLLVEHTSVGTMILGSTAGTRDFGDGDLDLCRTLSHQVSLAVENARLFESTQEAHAALVRAYDATLEGWSMALQLRDADTAEHTARVVELTLALAVELGVPEHEMQHVYRGALLHDIGKMTVPDTILRKPSKLTDDEWAIMKRHPDHARQMLEGIEYLAPALDIPYCHHERWDGTGYPRGLSGEEIPLPARIFAVVDVYEALTSDRPYRKAWPRIEALEHIRGQSGKHFDPRVVEVFLKRIV